MKRFFFSISLLACLSAVCLAQPSAVVGTWNLVLSPEMVKKMPKGTKLPTVSVKFASDGTMTGSMSAGNRKSTMKGTWRLLGNNLFMKSTHEDGKPVKKVVEEKVVLARDKKSFELPGSNGMGKMVKQK